MISGPAELNTNSTANATNATQIFPKPPHSPQHDHSLNPTAATHLPRRPTNHRLPRRPITIHRSIKNCTGTVALRCNE
jgi:hypothetical protein